MNDEREMSISLMGGDENAFGQLYKMYRTRLVYYGMKFLITRDEAEDIVSESFSKLWQARTKFSTPEHIKNFLFITVRNSALNLISAKERQKIHLKKYSVAQEAIDESFSHERAEAEFLHLIYQAVEQLPTSCREIFKMYMDELKPNEIASRLQISTATVRSQKRRAIQLIREWLKMRLLPVWTIIMLTLISLGITTMKY